jgi:hypothetical protein
MGVCIFPRRRDASGVDNSWTMAFRPLAIACSLALAGCGGGGSDVPSPEPEPNPPVLLPLRVYENPYAEVDWPNVARLKGQHHDHAGTREARISVYDDAGYDAMPIMDYSGVPSLDYTWKERRWPAESWLTATFLGSLKNIRFFFPAGEEVGDGHNHITTSFIEQYLEFAPASQTKEPWQYSTAQELLGMPSKFGGVACLAHPWNSVTDFDSFEGLACVEIFNAYGEAKRQLGDPNFTKFDANEVLVGNWDRVLSRGRRVIGIAVNDHFGPGAINSGVPHEFIDSGYVVVLAREATSAAYEDAFLKGAFFAVRDFEYPKEQGPQIQSIEVAGSKITIESDGSVRWITDGVEVAQGATLDIAALPRRSAYVRAEVTGPKNVVVYVQAFSLRPLGDVDGDFDVDEIDTLICGRVSRNEESNPVYVDACRAVQPVP